LLPHPASLFLSIQVLLKLEDMTLVVAMGKPNSFWQLHLNVKCKCYLMMYEYNFTLYWVQIYKPCLHHHKSLNCPRDNMRIVEKHHCGFDVGTPVGAAEGLLEGAALGDGEGMAMGEADGC
jgi:hypothetical protein